MNLEQFEKIIAAARRNPMRTIASVAILGLLAVLGMFAGGYFGHIGKQAAELNVPILNCEDFGVSINQKVEKVEPGETVEVSGSAQRLPSELHLWVAATLPAGARKFWPRDEVFPQDEKWMLELQPKLKGPHDVKRFAVFIVGEEGQKAIAQHLSVMHEAASGDYWAPMDQDATPTIVRCPGVHRVELK